MSLAVSSKMLQALAGKSFLPSILKGLTAALQGDQAFTNAQSMHLLVQGCCVCSGPEQQAFI